MVEVSDMKKAAEKWQAEWEKHGIFKAEMDSEKPKYYVLEMFPYPSASFLHVGHVRNYTIGDVFARFKRMNGFNVLYPMGYDSFGLPAETASKKQGVHPRKYTADSIKQIMKYQKALGNSYDWDRTISTCDPDYYKWNQYFFLKMMEKGLVYRKKAPVNWCPNCESVLANEEAEGGKCWRCEKDVVKKDLEQWFMKITAYADKLLDGLKNIDWSDKIKTMQENWIGKSEGTQAIFKIDGEDWPVFTTRVDTIFGVTFMVISAQHPRLLELADPKHKQEVEAFIKRCSKISNDEEKNLLEKEGVFIGRYAINPMSGEKIPVYAGNFVVAEYGAGMVMAVPAHDQRDYEFAKKYNIMIKTVIESSDKKKHEKDEAFTDYGVLVNSGNFSGMTSEEAKKKITAELEKKGLGKKAVNYKIRDWLISRQRYWGTPIPVIYCEKCGVVGVLEEDLPVRLPEDVEFGGKDNPLLKSKEFLDVKCPKCGGKAKRETDTMGGFVDSSWYFLRYCSPHVHDRPFERKEAEYWMPVDQYVGGAEHAVMHLIYARFFTMMLKDFGYITFSEPFTRLFNQGIVYKDGHKMSKSFGNVVFQTDISERYGIDTARLFLMFVSSPDKQMEWSDEGVEGSYRIIKRLVALSEKIKPKNNAREDNKINKTIKNVTEAIETFQYPRAIISIIESLDAFSDGITKEHYEELLKLISPFCPHIAEEMWHELGNNSFISIASWPKYDEKKIDPKMDAMDALIEGTRADINAVKKLTGMEKISKITLIVSSAWKYELYTKLKEELEKTHNPGEILKAIMGTELKKHGQDITKIVPSIVKDPSKLPAILLNEDLEIDALHSAAEKFSEEFGAKIEIVSAENSNEAKARNASPGKPAIVLS